MVKPKTVVNRLILKQFQRVIERPMNNLGQYGFTLVGGGQPIPANGNVLDGIRVFCPWAKHFRLAAVDQ